MDAPSYPNLPNDLSQEGSVVRDELPGADAAPAIASLDRVSEEGGRLLEISVAQHSSAGRKPRNEDAIGIRIPTGSALSNKGAVAVIADGVSTAEGGKEASETAVTAFLSDYYSTHDAWSVKTSAIRVINALNTWLYGQSQKALQAERGHITTFSALILKAASAHVFHVGDSRVYRLRDGELEQVTRDHATPVSGGHRYLARALGIDLKLDLDYHCLDLQVGDLFVLTTDGVHESLDRRELQELLNGLGADQAPSESLCRAIVDKALAKGSDDNLSLQLLRVEQCGQADADDLLQQARRLPFPPPLQPGMIIDGWRVVREIQATARSEVYLVERSESEPGAAGNRAVMKVPSAYHEDDPAYIERFLLEEWIGSRIQSPHVVRVIRPPQPRHFLYYLTEYVEGPTLAQLLREHTRLSIVDATNIVSQVASGLRAFHRKESLHQDIKPENIIYGPDGVKIIDFGSTRVASIQEARSGEEALLGTPEYTAPEYHLGHAISPASDQFSLAVLYYSLVTGKHPYGPGYGQARNPAGFTRLTYIPASRCNPLVPGWIDAALQRALSLQPARRYEALSEFIQDLKRPSPTYTARAEGALIDRHPVAFWRGVSAVLLLLYLLTLLVLL